MAAIHFLLWIFLLLPVCLKIRLVWQLREKGYEESSLPITADWISELSAERYRPMLRLLDTDELDLLKSQPHFTAGQESQFRSNRAQIFRGYLRCLHADLLRLSRASRGLRVQSRDDRPGVARVLIRRQVRTIVARLHHQYPNRHRDPQEVRMQAAQVSAEDLRPVAAELALLPRRKVRL